MLPVSAAQSSMCAGYNSSSLEAQIATREKLAKYDLWAWSVVLCAGFGIIGEISGHADEKQKSNWMSWSNVHSVWVLVVKAKRVFASGIVFVK